MLFWIFVGLIVIGFAVSLTDRLTEFGAIVCALATVVAIFMTPFVIGAHIGIDGKIASFEARYDSLVYQYENDIYDNNNDLGKRELMEDIEKWNTDLARKKENQDDVWIGIFIPDIYDQFEFIELK